MNNKNKYIKLEFTNDKDYIIYVINEDKTTKLSKKNTLIMSKVLRKHSSKPTKGNTYLYFDIIPIMADYTKEKQKIKRKKANREKSKKIARGIIFGVTLTLIGTTIFNSQKKDKSPINTPIKTENDQTNSQNEETKTILDELGISEDELNNYIKTSANANQEINKEEPINETNQFDYYFEKPGDKQALENATKYMNIFKKYEKIYGVDANLLCAIAAQESSGIHKSYSVNGFATGLMGIENIWDKGEIRAFNFEKNCYETITIDYSKIGNIEENVLASAVIVQNYFYCTINYNNTINNSEQLAFSLQKYNMGPGNMKKLLNIGNDWINNRTMIKAGDSLYFEHVLSRLDNNSVIKIRLEDGSYHCTTIYNKSLETKLTRT